MFTFFTKKTYLVDLLEGFVDIHNHILPGIDDGSKNVEESIELIEAFGDFGVTSFICTPHIMSNYYENTPETIKSAHTKLTTGLAKKGITDVSIEYAAEHMIDTNFEVLLENELVMIMNTHYLLVEMSFLQPPLNFDSAIDKVAGKNLFPLLAHPERYGFLHGHYKKFETYKNEGVLFQLNILSLAGYYGKRVQQTALKLLNDSLIDFIATDVHNMRQLKTLKELQVSNKVRDLIIPVLNKTIYNFY